MTSYKTESYSDASYILRLIASTFNWLLFLVILMVCDALTVSSVGYLFFVIPLVQLIIFIYKGKTIGMLIFGIAVIDKTGAKPDAQKLVAHMLFGFIMSIISIPRSLIIGKKEQLHDRILGTRVVHTGENAVSNISRRTRASLIDITAPIALAVAFLVAYTVMMVLYIFVGALTAGMLWFLLEDEVETASVLIYNFAKISILFLFLVQIVLFFYKKTSIGKFLYKIKIVDSGTGGLASTKQLIIRGLINNWITKVTIIYPIVCYTIYKKTGEYPHDKLSGTTVSNVIR